MIGELFNDFSGGGRGEGGGVVISPGAPEETYHLNSSDLNSEKRRKSNDSV